METFSGRVAFVTGGASGIGFGMVTAFLRQGMKVVVADVAEDYLSEAERALAWAGESAHFLRLDVTDRMAMRAAAVEAAARFGKVHVLCNNAGVTSEVPIEDAGYAEWDWVMGVNVNGLINGLVEFLPGMKAHGEGGHIVNTASMAAIVPGPSRSGIYTGAKFAVRGITEALRLSVVGWRIGVSLLCPGMVDTRILQSSLRNRDLSATHKEGAPARTLTGAMDPMAVGLRVLEGIRRNDAFIFTHAGWRDEIGAMFAEIVQALPDGPPATDAFNTARRETIALRKTEGKKLKSV